LCPSDLSARLFNLVIAAQSLIEGEADGLDGDVGGSRALEKRSDRRSIRVDCRLIFKG